MSIRFELVQAVAAFVPAYVVNSIVGGHPPQPGDVSASEGAVIFADVAGFTPMAERLVRIMRDDANQTSGRGAEELTRILNGVFSAMIERVHERGGVITRFSGDALTAYFERPIQRSPSEMVVGALACARAMHQAISHFAEVQVEHEIFPISVRMGLGYGPCVFLTLGGQGGQMESVLVGRAVSDAALAQSRATPSQVALAPSAYELLPPELCGGTGSVELSALTRYPVALSTGQDAPCSPGYEGPLAGLDEGALEQVLRAISSYLPHSIYDRVILTQGDLPGDYRRVTNLFVYFDGLNCDASDVGERAQAYYYWAHSVVARYEGRLIHMLADDKGTSLHILFGAPDKHADDPTRGLRCALALQRDPGRPSFVVRHRIGVASGIVFAATIGSPQRREYTVIGDDVNLSARLTAACPPGEVLVDVYTRDRTAPQFDFEALPPMQLKGKSQPVIAHRLLAERQSETGLVARYLASRWRIVGRDTEVADLEQAAARAMTGTGHIIALEGRAGVGKTRLVEEVVRQWVAQGGDGFVGQAVSHGLNSPYHVWASFWQAFFGFDDSDSAEQRWQKVKAAVVAEAPDQAPWMGVLAPVLGLPMAAAQDMPSGEPHILSSLDAADRRRKLFELTHALLTARARRQPLLALFEDLHWADRPSLELIDYLSERISQAPVLLCLCFRPRDDLEMDVLSSMQCTWRILDELPPEQSIELVRAILGEVDLPPEIEQEIYDKTQGNPLFVEEIVNSFIASGMLVPENGQYRLSRDPGTIVIPDTLQDLLMARIDRLEAPSRDLVQVASVIDRRFPYSVLRGIYPYPMSDLEMQERLNELIRPEDLTRLERPEPDLVYLFKHALTRDVAYASLPFGRRSELHRRAGEFIETNYTDHLEEYYSTLAHHFDQSKQWERALQYALSAGMLAQQVYANDEALRYYQQVENYLAYLPAAVGWPSALRMALQRSVLHRLNGEYELAEADLSRALDLAEMHHDTRSEAEAYCLLADLRYYEMRNEESLSAAQRAHSIALAHLHTAELNTALVQLGIAYQMLGDIGRSMEYLQEAHKLAERRDDRLAVARALNTMAVAWLLYQGNLDQALDGFQKVLEIRREAGAKDREAECLANIATVQFRRGDLEAALEAGQAALRVGKAAGWQYGLSYVQLDLADVHCYVGDYETGQLLIQEAQENLIEGDELGQAYVQLWLGRVVYFDLGRDDLGVPMLEASLQLMRKHEHFDEMIGVLTALGASYLRQGQLAEARACLQEAHDHSLTQQFTWQRSEICYRLGLLALAAGTPDEAEEWCRRGLTAVDQGSAPDWLGPLHVVLARVAQRRGAHIEEVSALYQQALSLAQARCRAVERAWVLREAGHFWAAHADDSRRTEAQALVRQADEWLAARGILGGRE